MEGTRKLHEVEVAAIQQMLAVSGTTELLLAVERGLRALAVLSEAAGNSERASLWDGDANELSGAIDDVLFNL